jgi:hypothetical protein
MNLVIFGALFYEKVVLIRPVSSLGTVVKPVVELENEITHVILAELSVNVFDHQRLAL